MHSKNLSKLAIIPNKSGQTQPDSLDICLTAHFMRDSSFIKTQTSDFVQTVLSEVFDVRSDTFGNSFVKDLARLANLPDHNALPIFATSSKFWHHLK